MKKRSSFWPAFALAAMAVMLLFSACDQATGPDTEPEPVAKDSPTEGTMTAQTADAIFGDKGWHNTTIGEKTGVEILEFRDTAALKAYLDANPPQAAQRQAAGTTTLKLGTIEGKPVIKIAASAFAYKPGQGRDADITSVITKVELPGTIEELGENLFEGVQEKTVTIDIPQNAPVLVKIVEAKVAAAKEALGTDATEEQIVDAVAKAKEEAVKDIKTAMKKTAGTEAGVAIIEAPAPAPGAPTEDAPILPPHVGPIVDTPDEIRLAPKPDPNPDLDPPPTPAVITYQVTYNGNGGSGTLKDGTRYTSGSEVTLLHNNDAFQRPGYDFNGWDIVPQGNGANYPEGKKITISGNITLYAQWVQAYRVTYDENGATGGEVPVDGQYYKAGEQATVRGNTGGLSKDGSTFGGWSITSDGSGQSYNASDEITIPEGGITLYAKWNPIAAPQVQSKEVAYNESNAVSVEFTLDTSATDLDITSVPGWTIKYSGNTITATLTQGTAGTPETFTLTVARKVNPASNSSYAVTVMPVSGKFSRSSNNGTYTVVYYDENGAAGLKNGSGTTTYYYVEETDSGLRQIFDAVYTPNKEGSTDAINEVPAKTTIPYTETISEAVLVLFQITIGTTETDDKIEIKGTSLPTDANATNTNLIVIDIGLPGGTINNDGLPKFVIPHKALGDGTTSYAGIRLRVNRGASLIMEADNSAYEAGGPGDSCEAGNFKNGCVEVMAGGKLRDGAYEGFPLGSNAVILNRLNSYLAIGPESTFNATEGYDKWFAGWLIGPEDSAARIRWNSGDQPGNYIEVRNGKLAISANVTVKKSLGLIYSVWFVNGPCVTIDIEKPDNTPIIGTMSGLAANGAVYKFYGTAETSGGINPGNPEARIIVKAGNILHKAFLTNESADMIKVITPQDGVAEITITNKGGTGGAMQETYENGISGYLNWEIPDNANTVSLGG